MDLMTLVQEGGAPALLIAVLALVATPASLALTTFAYVLGRPRLAAWFAVALAALAALAIGLGWAGWALGMRTARAAVAAAAVEDRDVLLVMASSEARACLVLGLSAAVFPLMGMVVTGARAAVAKLTAAAIAGVVVLALGLGVVAGDLARQQARAAAVERTMAMVAPQDRSAVAAAYPTAVRATSPGVLAGVGMGLVGLVLFGAAASPRRAAAERDAA